MKKVVLSIFVATIILASCKNKSSEPETDISLNDIALADTAIEESIPEYLYVTASSGLSLREYNNLSSDRLAKMPYGTKVKVIVTENKLTMNVGGIPGGMNELEFNRKKGFAFNGYLSKFFPPERDIKVKGYARELKTYFPAVGYTESVGGSASKPSNTETLSLPTTLWHEAFFVAQQLFDFPKEFDYPNPKGKDKQVIQNSKSKDKGWKNQLEVSRHDNELERIEYVYESQKFDSTITILKDGNTMKISRTETIN
ncbi:MAG: hypothetical protein ACI83B_001688 [Sediminicola sp.]|jgi:hypothetical protein|tara:strand:+ start:3338 stop:4105 length:768 start_codon:yes stop_codon:yes gene_type:complete